MGMSLITLVFPFNEISEFVVRWSGVLGKEILSKMLTSLAHVMHRNMSSLR